MEQRILGRLREIEKRESVRILLAVESGSRAWGFSSPDSDYDVRFLYVRPETEYLRLDAPRDVIELPIDDALDVSGWDIRKALRLLYGSNPTLFEWFASPIVYRETAFSDRLRAVMNLYFSPKKSLFHYISMAEHNCRSYLEGELVPVKKYFYVLRPVLACRWILEKGTPPPMLFSELIEAELPEMLSGEVRTLLERKRNTPEIQRIPRVERLNAYLDTSIAEVKAAVRSLEDGRNPGWNELNRQLLQAIREAGPTE